MDDVIEEDKKKEEHNSIDNFKVITDINEVKINEETAIWLDTTIVIIMMLNYLVFLYIIII